MSTTRPPVELAEVRRAARRLARRQRLARALRWSLWGVVVGGTAALAVALAARLSPILDTSQVLQLGALTVLVCAVLGGMAGTLWSVKLRRLLIAAELRLGARSRLSTALYGQTDGTPLSELQLRDASNHARSLDWRQAIPLGLPRRALIAMPVLAIAFAATLLTPNPQLEVLAEQREVASAQKQQAERVRETARRLERRADPGDPAARKALEELDKLRQDLQRGKLTREEAAARVSEAEARLEEANRSGPARSRAAIRKAASALAANPTTSKLAAAVSSGNREAAAEEARRLAEEMRRMSPAERARTQEALQAAAAAAAGMSPELSEALSGAASGTAEGSERLASELQQAMSDAQTADAIEGVLSQLQDSKSQIASSGSQPDGNAAQNGQPGNQGSGQGQDGQQPGGQGQGSGQQVQGQGSDQGQGQGQGSTGSTQTGGKGGGAKTGTGKGNQSGAGGARNATQPGQRATDPYEPAYAPSRVDRDGKLVRVGGRDTGGRSRQGQGSAGAGQENEATRPYGEAYGEYEDAASAYLDEHYIPISLKDYVREYFAEIAPSEEE